MSSTLLVPDEHHVHRNKSLKARLRNLSGRRKAYPRIESDDSPGHSRSSMDTGLNENQDWPAGSRRMSFTSDSRPSSSSKEVLQMRGRSQGRPVEIQSDQISLVDDTSIRHGSTTNANAGIAQAQVAVPVLSKPNITNTEYAVSPAAGTMQAAVSPVVQDEASPTRSSKQALSVAPTSTGFLSSVLSAATNLTSALGAGSSRTPPAKTKIVGNNDDTYTESPIKAGPPEQLGLNSPFGATVASLGLGELSLKDMGLPDISNNISTRSRASSSMTADTSVVASDNPEPAPASKPIRSGSVNTMQSGRRRGSTTVSVFGSDVQGQKITGFAVASNKRNREFHATFRSVPDADYLLDDYGCALQKEILVHGRMYVSESHICFNSNIFGWVTNLVIAFTDVISIEKKSTAGIFPNAIQISTLQAKHVFASFISRDTTYELIVNIWRLTHPLIQTTAHGVEIADDDNAQSDSSGSAVSDAQDASDESSGGSGEETDPPTPRRPSYSSRDSPKLATEIVLKQSTPGTAADFPGPTEHAITEAPSVGDGSAFAKHLIDECFEAPLGQVFELLYGADKSFMQEFLSKNQKLLDVQVSSFIEKSGKSVRSTSYVKPLSGPIGPKQTRCLLDDVIEMKDFERCVQIVQTTTSPDVPSGDAFAVKTRYSLMWGPHNTTRMVSNCMIEWTKNSWIKGPIEKGVNSGQAQFTADLVEAIRHHIAMNSTDRKKRLKAKKSKEKSEGGEVPTITVQAQSMPSNSSFGLSGIVENINTNVLIFVLLLGMMIAMMRMQRTIHDLAKQAHNSNELPLSMRWQHEESDLWTWLAERTSRSSKTSVLANVRRAAVPLNPEMTQLQIREALKQQIEVLKRSENLARKGSEEH